MDSRTVRYLAELGVEAGPPTLDLLRAVHAAHAARFPHDTVWMVRGRIPRLTVDDLLEALLSGEGGACMQLNVSLHWLLDQLGFDVVLHEATAQSTFQLEASRRTGDHCVITVTLPEGRFLVDAGCGTGHSEPLPLLPGDYLQGPFRYRVLHLGGSRWRVEHDRRTRALRAVEFDLVPAALQSFEPLYLQLATDPSSPYRRALWAQRRTPATVEMLHLRTLRIRSADGWEVRQLETKDEWLAEMSGRFGLGLPDLDPAELDRLWGLTGDQLHDEVSVDAAAGAGAQAATRA